jgi:2-furoyl-CoA dehydrogenase large subunit
VTAAVRIEKYVTMHDCGRVLHPAMVAGQITGGFAHALGAALYEEHVYAPDGNFLTGTLADYLLPTAMEVPEPLILHHTSPSPFTPLGAKGVGEGNCMSTPVCIANAVADALGMADVTLPLVPARLAPYVHGTEVVGVLNARRASEVCQGRAACSSLHRANRCGRCCSMRMRWRVLSRVRTRCGAYQRRIFVQRSRSVLAQSRDAIVSRRSCPIWTRRKRRH